MTAIAGAAFELLSLRAKLRALITQHPKACLLTAALIASAIAGAWLMGHHKDKVIAKEKAAVAVQHTEAVSQQARGDASQAAAQIIDRGATRQALDITVHQENSRAIQQASGASVRLDTQLNDAGRRGLCRYRSYADDPACVELRGLDPGQLQAPGQGNAATGH